MQWNTPVPTSWFDLWSPTFLSLAVTLLSFVASRNNISGPLRYGLHKYGPWMQTFYEKAPEGSVWALVFLRFLLPWTQAWVMGVLAVGWQYILQHYREEVRNVTDQANNLCARATIVASNAQSQVAEAIRYELDALSNGAQVLRDSRQAQGIKASDFFNASQTAWTAVQSAAEATDSAYRYSVTALTVADNALTAADTALAAANTARNSTTTYSSNHTAAVNCQNHTHTASTELGNARNHAENARNQNESARNKAEVAHDTVTRYTVARDQDRKARNDEKQNADRAVGGTRKIVDKTAGLSAISARLSELAQDVRHMASVAVAAVEQGKMMQAKEQLDKAKNDLAKVEEAAKKIATANSDVRKLYITQILG